MSNFIVTGCAGFIGSHLSERLLKDGHRVLGVDDMSTGTQENLDLLTNNKAFTFAQIDISKTDDIIRLDRIIQVFNKVTEFGPIDGVFHTAALARIQPAILNPQRCHEINVTGIFNILEVMRMCKIPNIVFSSSSSIYGLLNKPPLKESMSPDCLNPYSLSKFIGEKMIQTWCKLYDLRGVSLRYFNVYGPREVLNAGQYSPVLGLFYQQALKDKQRMTIVGDGRQTRDMTHVYDVVEANVKAMEKCMSPNHMMLGPQFNVGTGSNISVLNLAKSIQMNLLQQGVKVDYVHIQPRPGEATDTMADISGTKYHLDWEPKISLSTGLAWQMIYYLDKYGYNK